MRRTAVAIVFLALMLLIGACQAGSAAPEASPTALPATETPTEPAERGPANDTEPAPATLTVNDQSRLGGIGTYCWAKICADMIGIPTMPEPMEAESPVTATLILPFERVPETVHLSVYAATTDAELDESARGYRWWRPEQELKTQPLKPALEQDVTLDLEPGLYVVNVFAAVENAGDVSYGFLLEVQ